MSTPRQIVQQTLDFANPERIAHSFSPSDFVWATCQAQTFATDWQKDQDGSWFRLDEWGNRWERVDESSKGEVAKGVLTSFDQLASLSLPDFSDPAGYVNVRQLRADHPDHWLIGGLPGFTFNVARKMRRMDQ